MLLVIFSAFSFPKYLAYHKLIVLSIKSNNAISNSFFKTYHKIYTKDSRYLSSKK
jgi:hypothetical protein